MILKIPKNKCIYQCTFEINKIFVNLIREPCLQRYPLSIYWHLRILFLMPWWSQNNIEHMVYQPTNKIRFTFLLALICWKSLLNLVLTNKCTYTYNFLVRCSSNKKMLFIFIWIELYTVWNLTTSKSRYTFACFCIPQLNKTVISWKLKNFIYTEVLQQELTKVNNKFNIILTTVQFW